MIDTFYPLLQKIWRQKKFQAASNYSNIYREFKNNRNGN